MIVSLWFVSFSFVLAFLDSQGMGLGLVDGVGVPFG